MRGSIRPAVRTSLATTLVAVGLGLGQAAVAPAAHAVDRPDFQLPFPCGEQWKGATYASHGDGSNALDLNMGGPGDDAGKPVVASAAGTASAFQEASGSNTVRIDHGNGWTTIYRHFSGFAIPQGQAVQVDQGDRIGYVGETGHATGTHLHFEENLNGAQQHITFDGDLISYASGTVFTSRNCATAGGDKDVAGAGGYDDLALVSDAGAIYRAGGDGNANFYYRTYVDTIAGAEEVEIGEVTGDDHQDLVVRAASGSVYRLTNKGDGTFYGPVEIATGWQNITDFAVGDVTGDGVDDLVGLSAGGYLYRALRNGEGTFWSKVSFASGWDGFRDLAVDDVTGDAKDEILAISPGGSIYRATYQAPSDYSAKAAFLSGWGSHRALTVGDYNHDGRADLLGVSGATLHRQIASGSGTYYGKTVVDGGVGDWSAIADLG